MKSLRWACLAIFLFNISGCGQPDASTDPAGTANRQERADKIEQLKAKSAARAKKR